MAAPALAQIKFKDRSQVAANPMAMGGTLACVDFFTASFSVLLGFHFWAFINSRIPAIGPAMLLVPLLTIAVFLRSGLYPGLGLTAVTQIRTISGCITTVYLFLTGAMFMTRDHLADSRGGFFLAWLFSLIIVPVGKWAGTRLLMYLSLWGVPVVIIGSGSAAQAVVVSLRQNEILGYRPVACISEDRIEPTDRREASVHGVPVAGSLDDIEHIAAAYGAQHAIVAIPSMPPERLVWHMRSWSRIFPRVLIVPNLAGLASLWIEPRDLGAFSRCRFNITCCIRETVC